jgi:hypothetical protein
MFAAVLPPPIKEMSGKGEGGRVFEGITPG